MTCKYCEHCKLNDVPDMPIGLAHPHFKWVAAKDTDVQATWRKHGWVPPTEQKAKNESRS